MATQSYPAFDATIIAKSPEAAKTHDASLRASSADSATLADGSLKMSAECISVTVQNGRACLNLPLGIGNVCPPIPACFPNGTAAQACLDICTVIGVPCGVEVSISVAGRKIVSKGFGCSC